MGSWFSSSPAPPPPANQDAARRTPEEDVNIRSPQQQEHDDALVMRDLADRALRHYNSKHPGAAKFHCPCNLTKELELNAACVGFRKDLWYHINFLARPRDGDVVEMRRFFAELRFEPCSGRLVVETCTILEKPIGSTCIFCPDESKILHPSDSEFKCGKQGHDNEFFRHRCGMDGRTKEFFSRSDMLQTPFLVGGSIPRYRLDWVEE
ncbi:unnamed protein product [Alopecurus aequalis]